jgi:hypothetical protein
MTAEVKDDLVATLEELERDLAQHYRNDAWLPASQTSAHYARSVRSVRDELATLRQHLADVRAAVPYPALWRELEERWRRAAPHRESGA